MPHYLIKNTLFNFIFCDFSFQENIFVCFFPLFCFYLPNLYLPLVPLFPELFGTEDSDNRSGILLALI